MLETFYPSPDKFQFFSHICFVVCVQILSFRTGLTFFGAWLRVQQIMFLQYFQLYFRHIAETALITAEPHCSFLSHWCPLFKQWLCREQPVAWKEYHAECWLNELPRKHG